MSGMTDARRVLGFLDVFGDFDPTLLFVLGGAVTTTAILFRFVLRRGSPVLASTFHLSNLVASITACSRALQFSALAGGSPATVRGRSWPDWA